MKQQLRLFRKQEKKEFQNVLFALIRELEHIRKIRESLYSNITPELQNLLLLSRLATALQLVAPVEHKL